MTSLLHRVIAPPPPDRDLPVDEPSPPADFGEASALLVDVVDGVRSPDVLRPLVRAAARRLDAAVPGWFHRVVPERLDVSSVEHCVLAQVYGAYGHGLIRLFGSRWIHDADEPPAGDPCRVAFLAGVSERLWLDEVAARLAASCVPAGTVGTVDVDDVRRSA